jgi:hypothetical protein
VLGEPPGRPLAGPVRADAGRLAAELAPELPVRAVAALVAAWAQLFGIVSFELFGQFNQVVEAREAFFEQAAAALAVQVGLPPGRGADDDAPGGGSDGAAHSRTEPGGVLPEK